MMQVKYRAWDKITNDWYDDKNQHLVVGLDGEIMNCWNGELMDVYTDRISLIQYTGQKDKNAVEIYEGYAIKGKFKGKQNFILFVRWNKNKSRFDLYSNKVIQRYGFSAGAIDMNTIEVIGNIYENPELLEVSHN